MFNSANNQKNNSTNFTDVYEICNSYADINLVRNYPSEEIQEKVLMKERNTTVDFEKTYLIDRCE